MTDNLSLRRNISLREHNTFGIDAIASCYLPITDVAQLDEIRRTPSLNVLPRLVLGGGSNLLLTGDFDGLVLHMCMSGIAVVGQDDDATYVRAAAGESWHGLVGWTLDRGFNGLENLSLIPGSVGASPIQNIGAYGVELKDCFHSLTAFDFDGGHTFTLDRAGCAFGYRDSIFKGALREKAVILSVTFALPRRWQPNLQYAELAQEIATRGIASPSSRDVSDAVIAIRTRKLPDPKRIGNAGSFFKNPVISPMLRDALLAQYPKLVSYPQPDGSYKLAAGWLIDQCGWKGRRLGEAGVYDKQALVLVNHGNASGRDIRDLATAVQADVKARFGVQLEPEPVIV